LSPQEIRAAAEVHQELDPEYHDAVVESFLVKVEKEIERRVETRLADQPSAPGQLDAATLANRRLALRNMALGSGAAAIPLSVLVMAVNGPNRISAVGTIEALVVVWILIAAVYAACALRLHPPHDHRG